MKKKIGINQKTIFNTYKSISHFPMEERFGKMIELFELNGFVITNSSYKRILKFLQNERTVLGLLK
jgi:hypothetical protein